MWGINPAQTPFSRKDCWEEGWPIFAEGIWNASLGCNKPQFSSKTRFITENNWVWHCCGLDGECELCKSQSMRLDYSPFWHSLLLRNSAMQQLKRYSLAKIKGMEGRVECCNQSAFFDIQDWNQESCDGSNCLKMVHHISLYCAFCFALGDGLYR